MLVLNINIVLLTAHLTDSPAILVPTVTISQLLEVKEGNLTENSLASEEDPVIN